MTDTDDAAEFRMGVPVYAPVDRAFSVFVERCHDWWPSEHRLGHADRVAVVLEPRLGGRWYERTADGKESNWGSVLEWQPPYRVSLSWQIGLGFVPEPNPDRASRVDVVFTAEGPDRTQVTVVHSEFERHGDGWQSMRDAVSNDRGWPGILPDFAALAAVDASG